MTMYTKNKDIQILLMQQALDYLKKGFLETEHIEGVHYKQDIPEFIYDILYNKLLYFTTQLRLQNISDKTKIPTQDLRKKLREYTISELEKFKLINGKLMPGPCIDDKENFI